MALRSLATASKLAPDTAGSHILVHLVQRAVIRVSGQDALKFLQGYTTNDTRLLTAGGGHATAQATSFLNGKGRTVAEAVLSVDAAPTAVGGPTLYVDVDAGARDGLLRHLRAYKLRSAVAVEDASASHAVYAVLPVEPFSWTQGAKTEDVRGHRGAVLAAASRLLSSTGGSAAVDPRSPSVLGLRVVAPTTSGLPEALPLHHGSLQEYDALRMLCGVPEGAETAELMPLEWNAALLHAVSFDKGCYLGQELVARTHHRGLVRKRVLPVYLTGASSPPRPPAPADPLAAALVRRTEEAVRAHLTGAGGAGRGQGHGPAQTHVEPHVPHAHSKILHGGHAPSKHAEHGRAGPGGASLLRLPFPWLDSHWRGSVEVGAALESGGGVAGRAPGRVVSWRAGTNLAMAVLRVNSLPTTPRAEAAEAARVEEESGGGEGDAVLAQLRRVHERVAAAVPPDLHVGAGDGRLRAVPVLPQYWRLVGSAVEEDDA